MTTTDTITLDDISESDDALWEAVVAYEDGDHEGARATVAKMGPAARAIAYGEFADIDRKALAGFAPAVGGAAAPRRLSRVADFYEAAILGRQEGDRACVSDV